MTEQFTCNDKSPLFLSSVPNHWKVGIPILIDTCTFIQLALKGPINADSQAGTVKFSSHTSINEPLFMTMKIPASVAPVSR